MKMAGKTYTDKGKDTETEEPRIRYAGEDVEEVFRIMEDSPLWPALQEAGIGRFPFTRRQLLLLRGANPLPQRYHYIEQGKRFAFFTVYDNRMDLLTFGKAHWYMDLQTIAYPCSFSGGGYVTNDVEWMLGCIKRLRGCKLVLNIPEYRKVRGMAVGETLPTCRLYLRPEHTSLEAYLRSLRSPYRRRMRLALRRCGGVRMERQQAGQEDLHPLYLQTFARSAYPLERLERSFFEEAEGERLVFFWQDMTVGFVLLEQMEEELVFLLCGMEYAPKGSGDDAFREEIVAGESTCAAKMPFRNADLYYFMLLQIVDYAICHHCKSIDFGQTSEKTKLKFGAVPEKRYFYAHHSNPFLNLTAILGRHILEYRYAFPEYHVYKKE
ncbi:MAG: hypothetical protein IJ600_08515 [Lachnospiraceae bacterium]|nr:hypothetical protein [Lachnospiraceae bacterium]